jgi:hypothetical protein
VGALDLSATALRSADELLLEDHDPVGAVSFDRVRRDNKIYKVRQLRDLGIEDWLVKVSKFAIPEFLNSEFIDLPRVELSIRWVWSKTFL